MDLKTRIAIFAYLKNLKAPAQTHFLKHYLFLACFSSRNALTPEFLGAVKDEATHLRQRVRERLERREKLPLTYVAAFKALGWKIKIQG